MEEAQKQYIDEMMKFHAFNIEDFSINQKVRDKHGNICVVTSKTKNSIEVFYRRKSINGINCKQWFIMEDFTRMFKAI